MAEDEQRTDHDEKEEELEENAELLPDRQAMTVIVPPIVTAPHTLPDGPVYTLPVEPTDPA
jgi:hypothetical protein